MSTFSPLRPMSSSPYYRRQVHHQGPQHRHDEGLWRHGKCRAAIALPVHFRLCWVHLGYMHQQNVEEAGAYPHMHKWVSVSIMFWKGDEGNIRGKAVWVRRREKIGKKARTARFESAMVAPSQDKSQRRYPRDLHCHCHCAKIAWNQNSWPAGVHIGNCSGHRLITVSFYLLLLVFCRSWTTRRPITSHLLWYMQSVSTITE